MVKNNRTIPSMLQNLWDEVLRNQNIMIILLLVNVNLKTHRWVSQI